MPGRADTVFCNAGAQRNCQLQRRRVDPCFTVNVNVNVTVCTSAGTGTRNCYRSLRLLKLLLLLFSLCLFPSSVRAFSSRSFAFAFLPRSKPRSTQLFSQHEHDRHSSHHPKYNISILIIDHYDSFTYNLYDYFAQLLAQPPTVIEKDAFDNFHRDQWKHIDGIVLSPGPGSPHEQPPLSHQAITQNPDVPILGVCLGHQLIALNYGADVRKAPTPIHGQDHLILRQNIQSKQESPLFQDLPNAFRVVRYHSLAAYELPDCLQVLARSEDDNVIQAIQHHHFPHFGVQFHPESIGTQHGMALIENFCRIVQTHKDQKTAMSTYGMPTIQRTKTSNQVFSPLAQSPRQQSSEPRFRVVAHAFQAAADPEAVFESLYQHLPYSIWLDSSSVAAGRGVLDILAAPNSPEDVFEYNLSNKNTSSLDILSQLDREIFGNSLSTKNGSVARSPSQELAVISKFSDQMQFEPEDSSQSPLPFHYRGGFLGYLGYEVRHDTVQHLYHNHNKTAAPMQQSLRVTGDSASVDERSSGVSDTPTAAFFLARNSLVFHHPSRTWYMISLVEQDKDLIQVVSWMKTTKRRILDLTKLPESPASGHIHNPNTSFKNIIQFIPSLSKEQYEAAIAKCHELIRQGESYELCLTNQLEAHLPHALSTWELYKLLRQRNPAPYSAFFRWQHRDSSRKELSICCSSPERFMCVQRKQLLPGGPFVLQAEAKPIKGTARRVLPSNGICRNEAEEAEDQQLARELEFSLKNRAENLMIVDLLRNDMSRVCQIGSVHVAKLMAIESFATVHQMVSTIRGVLGTDGSQEKASNCIDLLRASFPGGSMTGAPKTRTMELLEELEQHDERGPYAGSLGYISVNGCMDMNIIIRSAVVIQDGENRQRIKIGSGGAITALSEPKDEYDEMLLKSGAVVRAVQEWVAAFKPPSVLDANATLAVSADSA